MDWFVIFKTELRVSTRVVLPRLKHHPFMTAFFVFIAFGAIFLGIRVVHIIALNPHIFDLEIPRYAWPLMLLAGVAARVAIYTYRKLLKERELITIFSTATNPTSVLIGKYLTSMVYILLILFMAFGMIWVAIQIYGLKVILAPGFFIEALLLIGLGVSFGTAIPILTQLLPYWLRYSALAATASLLAVPCIMILMTTTRTVEYLIVLGSSNLAAWLPIIYGVRSLQEAWDWQLSKPLRHIIRHEKDRLNPQPSIFTRRIDQKVFLILRKELLVFIRERDAMSTVFFAVSLLLIQLGIITIFGPEPQLFGTFSYYIYPVLLSLTLFLALVPPTALMGSAILGEEGKRLWILQSLPVDGRTILKGKSYALILLASPTAYILIFTLANIIHFPYWLTLFFAVEAAVMIIAYTAIGVWSGTRFANFDPSMRGMPDLMTQYNIISICGLISIVLFLVPAMLLRVQPLVGVASAIDGLGWAIVIFIICLARGAKRYDLLEIDAYA